MGDGAGDDKSGKKLTRPIESDRPTAPYPLKGKVKPPLPQERTARALPGTRPRGKISNEAPLPVPQSGDEDIETEVRNPVAPRFDIGAIGNQDAPPRPGDGYSDTQELTDVVSGSPEVQRAKHDYRASIKGPGSLPEDEDEDEDEELEASTSVETPEWHSQLLPSDRTNQSTTLDGLADLQRKHGPPAPPNEEDDELSADTVVSDPSISLAVSLPAAHTKSEAPTKAGKGQHNESAQTKVLGPSQRRISSRPPLAPSSPAPPSVSLPPRPPPPLQDFPPSPLPPALTESPADSYRQAQGGATPPPASSAAAFARTMPMPQIPAPTEMPLMPHSHGQAPSTTTPLSPRNLSLEDVGIREAEGSIFERGRQTLNPSTTVDLNSPRREKFKLLPIAGLFIFAALLGGGAWYFLDSDKGGKQGTQDPESVLAGSVAGAGGSDSGLAQPSSTAIDPTTDSGTRDAGIPVDAQVPIDATAVDASTPDAAPTEAADAPELDRKMAKEQTDKAERLLRRKRNSAAAAAAAAATEADDSYARAFRVLGVAKQRLGRWKEAREAYLRYVKLAPRAKDSRLMWRRIRTLKRRIR